VVGDTFRPLREDEAGLAAVQDRQQHGRRDERARRTTRRRRPASRCRVSRASSSTVTAVASPRLELGLPLLSERPRPLHRVLGAPERAGEERLEPEPVGSGSESPRTTASLAARTAAAPLAEGLRPRPRRRHQLGQRHHRVDEPDPVGFVGVICCPSRIISRALPSGRSAQPLRAARPGMIAHRTSVRPNVAFALAIRRSQASACSSRRRGSGR